MFTSEQIFMAILLDSNTKKQERYDSACQLFDIAIRVKNPNYAMYIFELIMDLQEIQLTDISLYPQFQQIIILLAQTYTVKLSTIRSIDSLMAFHTMEFSSRRILLFLKCVNPFLMKHLQDQIDELFGKTISLQDDFKTADPDTIFHDIIQ